MRGQVFASAIEVGTSMSLNAHLEVIQAKHAKLKTMIHEESTRPSPDLGMLQTLKKQKLLLKEEIERLRALELERMDAA
jgi:hypothetical protein